MPITETPTRKGGQQTPRPEKASLPSQAKAPKPNPAPKLHNARILIVDDHEGRMNITRDALASMTQGSNCTIVATSSPLEALALFKSTRPPFDLIVTDLMMKSPNQPEYINGDELIKEIGRYCAEENVRIPGIALYSGEHAQGLRAHCAIENDKLRMKVEALLSQGDIAAVTPALQVQKEFSGPCEDLLPALEHLFALRELVPSQVAAISLRDSFCINEKKVSPEDWEVFKLCENCQYIARFAEMNLSCFGQFLDADDMTRLQREISLLTSGSAQPVDLIGDSSPSKFERHELFGCMNRFLLFIDARLNNECSSPEAQFARDRLSYIADFIQAASLEHSSKKTHSAFSSRIDIHEVVEDLISDPTLRNRDCTCDIPDGLFLVGRKRNVTFILRQAFMNADKFRASERLTIHVEAKELHGRQANGELHDEAFAAEQPVVRISITDDGIGIPAENLPKVFSGSFSTSRLQGGWGLGFAKQETERQGGRVAIQSQTDGPNRGTTITFYLPKTPVEQNL